MRRSGIRSAIRGFNPDQVRSRILDGDLELRNVELEARHIYCAP
jgi:hypothetical protein